MAQKLEVAGSLPIEIKHAYSSEIIYDSKSRNSEFEILAIEGSSVTIKIQNPNHILYEYKTAVKEVKTEDDKPDLSSLISLLQGIPIKDLGDLTQKRGMVATTLEEMAEELQKEIADANRYILDSDDPDTPLNHYLQGIRSLNSTSGHFNDPNLEANLNKALAETEKIYEANSCMSATVHEAFVIYIKSLVKQVSDIKALLTTNQRFSYQFKVGSRKQVISVLAKAVGGFSPLRQVDTLAKVIVHPYKSSSWELVPTLTFVYASGGKEFDVKDGVITEGGLSEISSRIGFFVVRNIWNWGRYNEVRTGIGAGFSLRNVKDQQILDNLHIGYFANIIDFMKLGVGIGWAQVPTRLDQSAVGEALPPNVSSIEEIIGYTNKAAMFMSVTVVGLDFARFKKK